MSYKSGIYRWLCIPTGKRYIGRAVNLERRKKQFLNFNGRYSSKSDNIKGVDAARKEYSDPRYWEYKVLIECSRAELNYREKMCIIINQTARNGYNQTRGGTTGTDGYKHTDVTRKALSEKQASFQATLSEEVKRSRAVHASSYVDRDNPEYRKHLSEALRGHIESEATKAKIRESQRGNMKPILKLDRNLNLVEEYESIRAAANSIMEDNTREESKRCYAAVKNCISPTKPHSKTARGYYFFIK